MSEMIFLSIGSRVSTSLTQSAQSVDKEEIIFLALKTSSMASVQFLF